MNSITLGMFSFLFAAYPGFTRSSRAITVSFFAGIFVCAFLYVFTPFGLDEASNGHLLINTIFYGLLTTSSSLFVTMLLPRIFPIVFAEARWVVWKEIITYAFLLLLIACLNVLLTSCLYTGGFSLHFLLYMMLYTTVIGLVPISISIVIKQQVLLRRYRSGAARIETETLAQDASIFVTTPAPQLLQFKGDNQRELLELAAADWLAIMASDNYCQIYYFNQGRVEDTLFRTSLKKLADQVGGFEAAWRCHKSYLVNLQQVVHISGNAQGYRLHLANTELTVPVSRSLNAEVQLKLAKFHHAKA